MPERFKIFDAEPWRSAGLRRMNADNHSVFFYALGGAVTVTDILYAASDLEARLQS